MDEIKRHLSVTYKIIGILSFLETLEGFQIGVDQSGEPFKLELNMNLDQGVDLNNYMLPDDNDPSIRMIWSFTHTMEIGEFSYPNYHTRGDFPGVLIESGGGEGLNDRVEVGTGGDRFETDSGLESQPYFDAVWIVRFAFELPLGTVKTQEFLVKDDVGEDHTIDVVVPPVFGDRVALDPCLKIALGSSDGYKVNYYVGENLEVTSSTVPEPPVNLRIV